MSMDKETALLAIVHHARRERTSKSANKMVIAAIKALGISGEELLRVGTYLEVWNSDGTAYIPGSPSFDEVKS